jgi:hypothetical protein
LRGAAFLVTALAVIGAPARRLPAQVKESEEETGSFYGTVRSAELRPLAAATVETPELGRIAVTNQKGEFYLRDLPLGAHDVQVGYLGLSYNAVIEVSAGEVAIKHYKLDLTLAELEPLVVEAQAAAGMKMREFVRREARSAGLFLDRDDIDRLGPLVTSDMLSGQAGVESQDYANGRRSVSRDRGRFTGAGVRNGRFLPAAHRSHRGLQERRPNPGSLPLRQQLRNDRDLDPGDLRLGVPADD